MHMLLDVADDQAGDFIKAATANDGVATICTDGADADVAVIGTAEPTAMAGRGREYSAVYNIVLLDVA